MKKKILAAVLAVCVVVSCLSIAISAFGSTIHPLELDIQMTTKTDENRTSWYSYTPAISGTYSLLSYNTPATQCKLYIMEQNTDTGEEEYVLLSHAKSDKDYEQNGHKERQFCLTYDLEKGTTYYYEAFYPFADTPASMSGNMTVKLRCDEYKESIIDHIELSCPAALASCQNGWWNKDNSTGEWYYVYNPQRIITNMTITVYYSNGDIKKVRGTETEIDGYPILFKHSQISTQEHWYPQESSKYTANTLTVSILDATADFDVPISLASYGVSGKVVDYFGNPIKNAQVSAANQTLKTDANGEFVFAASAGMIDMSITTDNAIARKIQVNVNKNFDKNNFLQSPVTLVTCDYVADGVINAKDNAYAAQTLSGDELDKAKIQLENNINFDSNSYESLVLG